MAESITVKVTDEVEIIASLSRLRSPQLELRRLTGGKIRRLYLSQTVCQSIMDMASQVTAIMIKFEKDAKQDVEKTKHPSSTEIPIDQKKALTITSFLMKAFVQIETIADGQIRPQLAFCFNLAEWTAFCGVCEKICDALRCRASGKKILPAE